jgi:hypothetical protein
MPTNEAGLSDGQDQGDGGRTTASDMPGGEKNAGAGGQGRTQGQQDFADGGHLGAAGDPVEGKTDSDATGQGAGS